MRHVDEPFQISSTMEGRKVDDKLNTCFAKKIPETERTGDWNDIFFQREEIEKKNLDDRNKCRE